MYKKIFLDWYWLIIAIIGMTFLAYTQLTTTSLENIQKPNASEIRVDVISAIPSKKTINVHSRGTVVPRTEIKLISEISGRIEDISPIFHEGSLFEKNETLIQIEKDNYTFQLSKAKYELSEAEHQYALEQGRARSAKSEWKDLKDPIANKLFLREPQLQAATSRVDAAKNNVSLANKYLQRTSISVPFSGRINKKFVDIGQYVNSGDIVAEVFDPNMLEVHISLSGKQISLLDLPVGLLEYDKEIKIPVTVHGKLANKKYNWAGYITRVAPKVDANTRLFYVTAEINNEQYLPYIPSKNEDSTPPLVAGLFVDIEISGKQLNDVIMVPQSAIFNFDTVYVVNHDNQLVEKKIEIISTDGDFTYLSSVGMENQLIVINNNHHLFPGLRVSYSIKDNPSAINAIALSDNKQ